MQAASVMLIVSKKNMICENDVQGVPINMEIHWRIQIILWFSIVIPTEKAVICKSFVCYVHILFVYVLTAYLYLVKQENCKTE